MNSPDPRSSGPEASGSGTHMAQPPSAELLSEQVWTARVDGSFEYVNPSILTYFGRPPRQILADGWSGMVHPADLGPCQAAWSHALATGTPFDMQFRLRRADGQYCWHVGRATARRDPAGQIVGWVGTNTDIDEQTRVDEARLGSLLREQAGREAAERQRQRLSRLLEQAPAAICVLSGPEHRFSLLNQLYMKILGPQRKLIGRPIRQALPELEGQGFFELLDRVYESGERFVGRELPARIARLPGHELEDAYFNFVYEPTRDLNGRVDGIFVHAVEVTDLVRSRERIAMLQTVTAQLAQTTTQQQVASVLLDQGLAAVGAAAGAVMVLSQDGAWLHMLALAGYSETVQHDFVRLPVSLDMPISSVLRSGEPEFLPSAEAVAARFPQLADTHRNEGHGAIATVPLVADGRQIGGITLSFPGPRSFDADTSALLLALAGQTAIALERIRLHNAERVARAQAEAHRDRLQQVIDAMPEGVAIADSRGAIVLSNATARRIWGQAPPPASMSTYQEAYGVWRLDGQPYPSEEIPIARSLLSGEVVEGDQLLLRNAATGEMIPLLVNSAPLIDTTGTTLGAVTVFQDISAIKALDREKDEFLASASHDLRNPLGIIKGTAQMLNRRLTRTGSIEPERVSAGLKTIDATVTQMVGLIDQLLDVARLRMGQEIVLDRRPTDLVALARELVTSMQTATERHVLRVDAEAAPVIGDWDADRLRRVLNNLLSNAVKYSPAGGEVLITVGLDSRSAGDLALLSVQDHGIGIPAEDVPHVFQRFRRAANVAGSFEGTGIGLADVDQIVHLHGGTVTVESQYGQGTTFIVRLPLAAAPTAEQHVPETS